MRRPFPVKTVLNWIGGGLGAAGLVFVAARLASYAGDIDAARIGALGYANLAGLAILYGASNLLLAVAWFALLGRVGASTELRWAIRAYASSQLAKYVPGNIMQFAGRQAIGVAAGIGNGPLLKSTALELVVLAGAGLLFIPLVVPMLTGWSGYGLESIGAFIVGVAIAIWAARRIGGRTLGTAIAGHLGFLSIAGAIFVAVYQIAGGAAAMTATPQIAGAYVIAWLAGLVTPGAPAGLGVREAVLLFMLHDMAAPPVILLAVVLGRAVSAVGDLLFYLVGGVLGPRS